MLFLHCVDSVMEPLYWINVARNKMTKMKLESAHAYHCISVVQKILSSNVEYSSVFCVCICCLLSVNTVAYAQIPHYAIFSA